MRKPYLTIELKDVKNGPQIICEDNISLLIDKNFHVFTNDDDQALRRMFPKDSCIFVQVLKDEILFTAFKFEPGSIKIGTTIVPMETNFSISYDQPVPLIIGNMEFVITPIRPLPIKTRLKEIFKSLISRLTASR